MTRARARALLDGEDPVYGRVVAFALQGLIVLSAISVAIETVPGLPDWLSRVLAVEEQVILLIFSIEYLLRLWSSERPQAYAVSFFGIIDLAAILPSLLLAGTDLRSVRVLRLLRLVRLLKLTRYMAAADRLAAAFRSIRDDLLMFTLVSALVLYLCAAGIWVFEHEAQPDAFASIPHSLWWAIATLSTVGYGDVYPVTALGKMFTGIVLLIGLGVVAVPAGLLASALSTARRRGGDDNGNEEETGP